MVDLDDAQQIEFLNAIGGFVKLTGGGWPPEQRQEFIEQAAAELAELPLSLLVPAVATARKRVYEPKRFVSWIMEFVEADLRKLNVEREMLERLAQIAEI